MKRKHIGVFGGSFDPPHMGHLLAAVYALKVFELDEVWFVPTYRHAFEKALSPFAQRFQCCRILVGGFEKVFHVSTIERDLKSDGRMLLTLEALQRKFRRHRFTLIVGSDVYSERRRWYRFKEIEKKFGVQVVPRSKSSLRKLAIPDISSTQIRNSLKNRRLLAELTSPAVAAKLQTLSRKK